MTEVLTPSPNALFSSRSLRRNTSQPSLYIDTSTSFPRPGPDDLPRRYSNSLSSSAPSSPRLISHDLSSFPSCASTPSSSLSLTDPFFDNKESEIQFPTYDAAEDVDSTGDEEEATPSNSPPKSQHLSRETPGKEYTATTAENLCRKLQSVGDDLSIKAQPTRHVDYFSYDWEEEDVLSSWRHVVAKRGELDNSERLENAAWRTWCKSRNRLPVVPPQKLNWMKDHDVTWLYGPLQTRRAHKCGITSPISPSRLCRTDSFVHKKSILKKRSLSEVMLQRSLSNSTLVRQAVDSLVSQEGSEEECSRPAMSPRAFSDFVKTQRMSISNDTGTPTSTLSTSSSSSGAHTPSERRHIHFSEKVEQCIAINDDVDEQEEADDEILSTDSDDESDDGILMMKFEQGKERRLSSRCSTPRPSFSSEDKQRTIAMLPATTLRGHTPEPRDQGVAHPTLNKSASQETLKPSRPSANFLLDEDDDADLNWQPNSSSSDSVLVVPPVRDEDEELRLKGLRRTPSGMFMPDDDDEDYVGSGLFGRVIDTVNTARDIAHVIWNVGWRA